MRPAPILFNPEIRANAEARGIALTPNEVEQISANLNEIITAKDGRMQFTAGSFLDLPEAIEAMSAGFGRPVTVETPAVAIPAGANPTAKAMAANAAIREGRATSRTAEAEALVAAHGNPWATRSISRTRQALVRNLYPALADKLQQQAGVRR